jgi:carbon-monoxide dehydrogenase medium subunit
MWNKYITTTTIEETLECLGKYGERARLVAGSTDLILEIEKGVRKNIDVLIDISRITGQDQITLDENQNIHLGPLVTHNLVAASKLLQERAYPLVQAALEVGSPQIRNRGTIAGNLVTASPANDTITPLMALGAKVVLKSINNSRTIPLQELYMGVRRNVIQPDEMLVDIFFPGLVANQKGYFIKFALRKAQAISLVNVSVICSFDNGFITNAIVTLGAVAPTIIHAKEVEEFLVAKKLDDAVIEQAGLLAMHSARPISDLRGSAAYRKTMIKVMTRRALHAIQDGTNKLSENPILLDNSEIFERKLIYSEHDSETGEIKTIINGKPYTFKTGFNKTLLRLLREEAGLIGTKEGCAEGECGSCTIFLDGKAVMSCMIPAARAHLAEITTIEGFEYNKTIARVQDSFIKEGSVQCGYCTPGFIMSGAKLLEEKPTPSQLEIRQAISGNLCRCTGYYKIISAIEKAADYET